MPFNAAMVRAVLAGAKTQTRRVIKDPPVHGVTTCYFSPSGWSECNNDAGRCSCRPVRCPSGVPGDTLWVREAWRLPVDLDPYSGKAVGEMATEAGYDTPWAPLEYEADGAVRSAADWNLWPTQERGRYRHARFMPRWASRITLSVTDVRVERVQDISEEDARAEGVESDAWDECSRSTRARRRTRAPSTRSPVSVSDYRGAFRVLWNSINGKRPGCSWAANPWVWAIDFERAEGEP